MKEVKWMNVWNDFYQEKFEALCDELEKGEKVHIYVDCIGHTRAEWVEEAYVSKLRKKYGERLKVDESGWPTHYYLD